MIFPLFLISAGLFMLFPSRLLTFTSQEDKKNYKGDNYIYNLRFLLIGPMLIHAGIVFILFKLSGEPIADIVWLVGFFGIPLLQILLGVVILLSRKVYFFINTQLDIDSIHSSTKQKHIGIFCILAGLIMFFCASYLYWPSIALHINL